MPTQHEAADAKPLSQAEFRTWLDERPDGGHGHYELLNGRIVMSPPAGWPHAQIAVNVTLALRQYADRNRIGRVFDSSAGFDLPSGDTLEPDGSLVTTAQ